MGRGKMSNISIIPARSGSKGLVDKNIKLLCGKPLLAYSIEAAIKSNMFDEIMVSTDSKIYADIAMNYGASVPFLRSAETSTDSSSSWDMVQEVLYEYKKRNRFFDSFCLLQPTSPLRTESDIKKAYQLYHTKAAVAVVSVCEAEHSPLWCGTIPNSLELDGFINKRHAINLQKNVKFYRINGAIYIVNIKEFEKNRFLYRKGSYSYIMNQKSSVDIDTQIDFEFAEFLLSRGMK